MITYYHRFLPGIAKTLAPLHNALKGNVRRLEWSTDLQQSFDQAKQKMTKATMLAFPAYNAKLQLVTDASDTAIGAALQQLTKNGPQPIAFFSRKLAPSETRYSTFDRELLAVFSSIRHFRHFLEPTAFDILTDHMPLVHALNKKADPISARQRRQLSEISEYKCQMFHVPGKNNPVADALSRNCAAIAPGGLNIHELAAEQNSSPLYIPPPSSSLRMEWVTFTGDIKIFCDTSTDNPRPWIPLSLRKAIFHSAHDLSHPSTRATQKIIKKRYVWDSMLRDVTSWAKSCIPCQTSKITRHTESGISSFPQPDRRFGHIHVDIVGPLPQSEGKRYLFTIIDRSTRWPEAIPMPDSNTDSCVSALINVWISRFGLPDIITSDRGSVFTSSLWSAL